MGTLRTRLVTSLPVVLLIASLVTLTASLSLAAGQDAKPTGVIRGRVDVRRPVSVPERRPGTSDLSAPLPREATDRRRAVVFLETAPRGAFEDRELPRARMDQRRETFVPHVLAVMVGTTIDFPNSDPVFHNVFSLSKPQRFDLGRYPQGRSKAIRFDKPGVVRVFCDIHSHMSAFIVVLSHPYFAVTDADGRYRIEGVPPGTYSVAAWYEGETRERGTATVTDGGAVDLDFTVN